MPPVPPVHKLQKIEINHKTYPSLIYPFKNTFAGLRHTICTASSI